MRRSRRRRRRRKRRKKGEEKESRITQCLWKFIIDPENGSIGDEKRALSNQTVSSFVFEKAKTR